MASFIASSTVPTPANVATTPGIYRIAGLPLRPAWAASTAAVVVPRPPATQPCADFDPSTMADVRAPYTVNMWLIAGGVAVVIGGLFFLRR
jgi:hypothetical protein